MSRWRSRWAMGTRSAARRLVSSTDTRWRQRPSRVFEDNVPQSKSVKTGGPGRSRTADLRFRKPSLYPSELQGHNLFLTHRIRGPSASLRISPADSRSPALRDRSRPQTAQFRKPSLYPSELQGHNLFLINPIRGPSASLRISPADSRSPALRDRSRPQTAQFRKPSLYPSELEGHVTYFNP